MCDTIEEYLACMKYIESKYYHSCDLRLFYLLGTKKSTGFDVKMRNKLIRKYEYLAEAYDNERISFKCLHQTLKPKWNIS